MNILHSLNFRCMYKYLRMHKLQYVNIIEGMQYESDLEMV